MEVTEGNCPYDNETFLLVVFSVFMMYVDNIGWKFQNFLEISDIKLLRYFL